MGADEFRVFISAVSSEFGSARKALADDFVTRRMTVKVQDHFLPDRRPRSLLAALDDYIGTCTTVICIVGKRSGDSPDAEEAAAFADVLPDGVTHASYTQWEFHLARKHDKECLIYIATDAWRPDKDAPAGPDDPDLQRAFVGRIRAHYEAFASLDELRLRVALHDWPPRIAHQPNNLRLASIGALFMGRDDAMQRLRESLTRADGNAAAITTRQAIHGMGGIGKTRLAVEYAQRNAGDYTALLFVEAETPDQLRAQLAALTGVLGLREATATDAGVQLAAVLAWLQDNAGWLLIVDNLDSREALAELTPLLGRLRRGHVLVTSRLSAFPAAFAPLPLDVLQPGDAAAFLLRRTDGKRLAADTDEAEAATLAEELGWLALALEQAGAYIATRTPAISLADYRTLLRHGFDSVMRWSDPDITQYPRAAAAAWQTSVARLDMASRMLLRRLAFLAPEPIPASLFDVRMRGFTPPIMREALVELAGLSLVANVPGGGVVMHRLVMDVTRREWETKRSRLLWLALGLLPRRKRIRARYAPLTFALEWVSAAFVGDPQDVRNWPLLDPLVPHAEAVAGRADAAGIAEPTGRLMDALGRLYGARALYDRAEPLKRRALALGEAHLGAAHSEAATRLNNLAHLLQATNRLGEAEPLMRRAQAIHEASLGKDHPTVAIDLNNLAALLQATNRLGEAEPLMRRALAIDEASLGKDHPNVAIRLNNLAALLQDTNRLGEAEPLIRR
ncbi:MAG TPA: tetratricopeptide repeat protein, partial [Acetobacteraceae bacterium]